MSVLTEQSTHPFFAVTEKCWIKVYLLEETARTLLRFITPFMRVHIKSNDKKENAHSSVGFQLIEAVLLLSL